MLAQNNKIYKGRVEKYRKRPDDKRAIYPVYIPELSSTVHVTHTSPMYSVGYGGMLAIPDEKTQVLVYFNEPEYKWYYLTTIVDFPDNTKDIGPKNLTPESDAKNLYIDDSSIGHQVTYCNELNAGMKINFCETEKKLLNNVVITTEAGKQIILDDMPQDMIMIKNEHGDNIRITSTEGDNQESKRAIMGEAKGDVSFMSQQGGVELKVGNQGRDIKLQNHALPLRGANVNATFDYINNGNVSLISDFGDINLSLGTNLGRINITTPAGRIIIDQAGMITLYSVTNIQLKSNLGIILDAPLVSVNTANFNVNSTGVTNIKSTGSVAIDGSVINLNSGANAAIPTPANVLPGSPTFLTDDLY